MALDLYRKKRDFQKTPEPRGKVARVRGALRFVIQKHAATRLHYDFRLELDGVLKSWAVPKGPSLDPGEKRLAVMVEDHPLEYGSFEGTIPAGQYGGGSVLLWDRGTWAPQGDACQALRKGMLKFELHGEKLTGKWALIRIRGRGDRDGDKNWLLIKERDDAARTGKAAAVVDARPESVASGRLIDQVGGKEWRSNRAAGRGKRSRPARAPRAVSLRPGSLSGARESSLPRWIPPQLATLVKSAPEGTEWVHEIKFDGYRLVARIERGAARLWTRAGNDWTDRFPEIASALEAIPLEKAILDGEVVVLQPDGTTSFQSLQNAMRHGADDLVYFAFDLLHAGGYDLTRVPLHERKELLERILGESGSGSVRYSDHVVGHGREFHAEACGRRLEGIVSKRADAPYVSGRSGAWLKTKCTARQEFVIGGYTEPQGAREDLGALLVGVRENGNGLRYSGKVGTGFTQESLRDLRKKLGRLERAEAPFVDPPRMRGVHWVKPELVAEIAYTEKTDDGRLRHPSFQGLREDKPAREVVLESASKRPRTAPGTKRAPTKRRVPKKPPRRRPPVEDPVSRAPMREPPAERKSPVREPPDNEEKGASGEAHIAGVRLTHPDRVLYPEKGLTKLDLALYYETVGTRMLREVADRPLMFRRCPEGWKGPCFFQKHPSPTTHPELGHVPIREARGNVEDYLTLRTLAGLVALVQMGVLEVHLWGSRADRLEEPDRVVFDLDPHESVPWPEVVACARRLRERLETLGLTCFAKTSGGKGLHLVVPIRRGPTWDDVKVFSNAIASELARETPERITTALAKQRRGGKIFIDTLRNVRGATWVAPYSPRARSGAPVSAPVAWEELTPRLRADSFSVENLPARLARQRSDPWKEMESIRQTITAAMLRAARGRGSRAL